MVDFRVVELSWTGFVCRLRGVLPPCIQSQVSVRWRFAWFAGRFGCLFFQWISLVRFGESQGIYCFRADGLCRTFVKAAVVVKVHVLVSCGLLPAMPVGGCGVK